MICEKKILIIKAGQKLAGLSTIPGDFEDWIMASMHRGLSEFMTISVAEGELLPEPENVKAVVITGSAAMVSDHSDWIVATSRWLSRLVDGTIPVLGVCFGHQLLAYALGGQVHNNPKGVEAGTVDLYIDEAAANDALFAGMGSVCPVQTSHRQVVTRLPSNVVCLASTAMDACHAYRYGANIWGVQFHPEFDELITREYIRFYQADLQAAGIDPEKKLGDCRATPEANSLLKKFSELVGGI